jgi:two-component sensor histidine kinase
MVLMRDVSELRRREQELLTKDATIREIHHRVKNNLQTVAALLRLQARRVPDQSARGALQEAVRRVGTIALVHETLSQGFDETVDFDEIAVRGLRAVVEVATSEYRVESRFTGSFGRMRAEDATALAMIVSELVQNAVEHGLADRDGVVEVAARRETLDDGEEQLTVVITDDGVGLPTGFRPMLAGLGTRIVTSLAADLRGRMRWENASPRGTRVEFVARLRPLGR